MSLPGRPGALDRRDSRGRKVVVIVISSASPAQVACDRVELYGLDRMLVALLGSYEAAHTEAVRIASGAGWRGPASWAFSLVVRSLAHEISQTAMALQTSRGQLLTALYELEHGG